MCCWAQVEHSLLNPSTSPCRIILGLAQTGSQCSAKLTCPWSKTAELQTQLSSLVARKQLRSEFNEQNIHAEGYAVLVMVRKVTASYLSTFQLTPLYKNCSMKPQDLMDILEPQPRCKALLLIAPGREAGKEVSPGPNFHSHLSLLGPLDGARVRQVGISGVSGGVSRDPFFAEKKKKKLRRQRKLSLHQIRKRRHTGSRSHESPSPEDERGVNVDRVGFWQHAAPGHQCYDECF
eukprot:1141548-Pelagomonas_calceolata.AAC.4